MRASAAAAVWKPTTVHVLAWGLCAALLLAWSAGARAQDDEEEEEEVSEYARSGWFLSLQALYAFENFDVKGANADGAWGASGRFGYRFLPRLAAELQFESPITFDVRAAGSRLAHVTGFVPSVNARGYLLTGRWQPYVVGGIGAGVFLTDGKVGNGNSWDAGFTARVGAGVELYGDDIWAMTVEGSYVIPTGDVDHYQYGVISWGFSWRL